MSDDSGPPSRSRDPVATASSVLGLITSSAAIVGFVVTWLARHSFVEAIGASLFIGALAIVGGHIWRDVRLAGPAIVLPAVIVSVVLVVAAANFLPMPEGTVVTIILGIVGAGGLLYFAANLVIGHRLDKVVREARERQEWKTCPDCGEQVRAVARTCRFCNYVFEDAVSQSADRS